MSLTRAMLRGMGLTDEQISAIIDEHTSVTNALKDQVKQYKDEAEKLPDVQKELDKLKEAAEKNEEWKEKFDKEHTDFENYKADILTKETTTKLHTAYRKLLTECKVGEKQLDCIIKATDFKNMKLNDDGTLENAEELKKQIGSEWAGFISTEGTKGADVGTPPAGDNGKPTSSRAAELAAKYHENLYGKSKED